MSLTKQQFVDMLRKSDRLDPFFAHSTDILHGFGTKENLILTLADRLFSTSYVDQVGTLRNLSVCLKILPIKWLSIELADIVATTVYLADNPSLKFDHNKKTIAEIAEILAPTQYRSPLPESPSGKPSFFSSILPAYAELQSLVSGYRSMNPMMQNFVVRFFKDCFFINKKIQSIQYVSEQDRITQTISVMRNWMRKLLPDFNIFVTHEGMDRIPTSHLFTLAVNHQSSFDTISLMYLDLCANVFLATDTFANIPFFGPIYRSATVLANLDSDASKGKAFIKMKQLPEQGIVPGFFPEGQRNTTEDTILSFDIGAFLLSIEKRLPVVPACIQGTREICPVGEKDLYPGNIHIAYLNPVSLDEQEFTILRQLEKFPKENKKLIKEEQMKLAQLLSDKVRNIMLNYLSAQKSLDK